MKKKVIEFFRNRIVIAIFGLLALCALIWFAGPYVKFGQENTAPLGGVVARLLAIVGVVLLWGLNNLRVQLTHKHQNDQLVEDLGKSQKEILPDHGAEQTAEELRQLGERFSEALATLKRLKFRRGGRQQALYELPWYIMIGPPGAGKTTALLNSSLEFPLDSARERAGIQGVGGTRNCEWWFTNDAVLIDTAGRYTTQDSDRTVDSKAWEGFLSLLKKHRRRRPINGAIVAISIRDLLLQSSDERAQQAKAVRMRLDELMQQLEIRFPIYVILTKADFLSGFSEYFADLTREEREQVWGITLPDAPEPTQAPDFGFLQNEYGELLKRLYSRQIPRMHAERDGMRRAAIQGFPQQVATLETAVIDFVKQAFAQNRYHYQPYLRGVYFTSGTQDGTPVDRIMTSVSTIFGITQESAHPGLNQGKSFFLGALFRRIILPESELAGSNRRYELTVAWARRGAYAAMALASIALLMAWAGSVSRHHALMSDVQTHLEEFRMASRTAGAWENSLSAALPALNALAKASIVYDQEQHPWLSGMGLYDRQVNVSADAAYQAQLRSLFLPRLIDYLEQKVRNSQSGGELYEAVRTYLMFNKVEHMDKVLVANWFHREWAGQMPEDASRKRALETHLAALLTNHLEPYPLDVDLLASARTMLRQVPIEQRIYARLASDPRLTYKMDMLNQFGKSVRDVFVVTADSEDELSLPRMFTRTGYEELDLSPDSPLIAEAINETWVLMDSGQGVEFVQVDRDEISEKVKELYFADYIAHWDRLLSALVVREFTSVTQARDALSVLTDPVYSPLRNILRVAADNTTLSNRLLRNMQGEASQKVQGAVAKVLPEQMSGTRVDREYRTLNAMVRESGAEPAPVVTMMQKLQDLQAFLSEITIAPEPNKKAFEIAKARYRAGTGNAITSLRAYAAALPKPTDRWLRSLSDRVWQVVLASGKTYAASEWKARVHGKYARALEGRYPLNRTSRVDLALYDFNEFFKPKGVLDGYFEEFVEPFVDTRRGLANRVVDGWSMGFSETALAQIARAQKIKRVFFRASPEFPGISFRLMPDKMTKNDASFQLELGGNSIAYNHGPKFWNSLNWSGVEDAGRVRIVFQDLNGDFHSSEYDGPWAWFRLQDRSRLQKTKQPNVYKATYTVAGDDGEHRIEYLIKADSVDNPFGEHLLAAFRCPEHI